MPTYVVAGASRGLGLQFVNDLLARGDRVVALARSPTTSDGLQTIKDNKNLTIVKADVVDPVSLKRAVEEVSEATGGAIDVLINNASVQDAAYQYNRIIDFQSPEELIKEFKSSFDIHTLGPILTTNAFLPLLRKGTLKKVINLNTGMADPDAVLEGQYPGHTAYAVSKAGLHMATIKYATALKGEGFTFLDLSPGVVNTATGPPSPEELPKLMAMIAAMQQRFPNWTGPSTPAESVAQMLPIIDKLTIDDSGKFLSHKGNREWI